MLNKNNAESFSIANPTEAGTSKVGDHVLFCLLYTSIIYLIYILNKFYMI